MKCGPGSAAGTFTVRRLKRKDSRRYPLDVKIGGSSNIQRPRQEQNNVSCRAVKQEVHQRRNGVVREKLQGKGILKHRIIF